MPYLLGSTTLQVQYHHYFQRGKRFAIPVGQFSHWVLLAPEEGTFAYELKGERGEVGFGQLLFCPPHCALRRRIIGHLSYHIIAFSVEADSSGALPAGVVTIRDTLRLSSTFHHLREFAERESPLSAAARTHLLQDMLYLHDKEKYACQPAGKRANRADHGMTLAMQLIEERAYGSFSLRQVADEVRLSPVQLTRRFRDAFGQTPVSYLTSLRLAKARVLLLESEMPLRQIAGQCGFNSEQYFSRVFYQATQLRPGEFRKTRRL